VLTTITYVFSTQTWVYGQLLKEAVTPANKAIDKGALRTSA